MRVCVISCHTLSVTAESSISNEDDPNDASTNDLTTDRARARVYVVMAPPDDGEIQIFLNSSLPRQPPYEVRCGSCGLFVVNQITRLFAGFISAGWRQITYVVLVRSALGLVCGVQSGLQQHHFAKSARKLRGYNVLFSKKKDITRRDINLILGLDNFV